MTYSILLENRKSKKLTLDIGILCIALFWMIKGNYLIGLILILLASVGFYTNRNLIVYFSEHKIVYPSFIPKTYLWTEVSNVILKDDILTIDFKNNKLLQSAIPPAQQINENEFNDFCKAQLDLKIKEL